MRFNSILFVLASLFGVLFVLATPLSSSSDIAEFEKRTLSDAVVDWLERRDIDIDDLLEARAKQQAKVQFSKAAKAHLDNLGLHGAERKKVKKWHTNIAKQEMKKHGAGSAQIKHLAHTQGSVDKNLHITANLWDKSGKRMKSTYTDKATGATKKGDLFHLHVGNRHVSNTYQNAVTKKTGKSL